jgi:uncharacterized phage infection (PIP) family protein YhgE
MTPSKYLFLRIASRLGYSRKMLRLSHITSESHLLKEAETLLGEAIWRETENVKALSVEYWNLKKLVKDQNTISKEIDQLQEKINETYEFRTESWKTVNESIQDLADKRKKLLDDLYALTRNRDYLVVKARKIRRHYQGLKTKQEVLRKEGDQIPEIVSTSTSMLEIRAFFEKLREERAKIGEGIAGVNAAIKEIDRLMNERKKVGQSKVAENWESVGDASQQISVKRTELNSIQLQIRQRYGEVGRYISINSHKNPECKKASRDQRGLISVMAALRKSIQYNMKLAERQ